MAAQCKLSGEGKLIKMKTVLIFLLWIKTGLDAIADRLTGYNKINKILEDWDTFDQIEERHANTCAKLKAMQRNDRFTRSKQNGFRRLRK